MRELKKEELQNITGGAVTASLISAVITGVNSFLEVGRSLGTAIRRFFSKNVCSVN